jgi:hypothetical protein
MCICQSLTQQIAQSLWGGRGYHPMALTTTLHGADTRNATVPCGYDVFSASFRKSQSRAVAPHGSHASFLASDVH